MRGQDREQRGAPIGILSVVLMMLTASCAGAPAFPQHATAIPVPRPVSTSPSEVSAYYFPSWPTLDKWKVLDAFPERTPLLGYYREGDPTVMRDETALSAPYAAMVDGYEEIWYSIAVQRRIDYAPVTEPGWDSRSWGTGTRRTPSMAHCRRGIDRGWSA